MRKNASEPSYLKCRQRQIYSSVFFRFTEAFGFGGTLLPHVFY